MSALRHPGDQWAVATSLNNQGNLYVDLGQLDEAEKRLEEAVALLREIGDSWYYGNALNNLGNVARSKGEFERAHQLYDESLSINRDLGDGWALAYLLEDIGALNAAQGHAERAFTLIGAAEELRESIGAPLPPRELDKLNVLMQIAEAALEADARDQALRSGRAMTVEEAAAFALSAGERPASD